ncbi:hypothetical protein U9M48_001254 [Paspalum notatum var. saurae]|uniref:Uncharacterized protein n=1 Tax=Paspalum notatum var. saurae TaxID=547442 RepID=A0AAQ3PHV7_PASNO
MDAAETFFEIARAIVNAVETVRSNADECRKLSEEVRRVSGVLWELEKKGVVIENHRNATVRRALGDLKRALRDARKVVWECQQQDQNNIDLVDRLIALAMASQRSNQLRQARQNISEKMGFASFAINTHNMGAKPPQQQQN